MDDGKIVLNGKPREIFNSETARLIGVGIPKATLLWQLLQENKIRLEGVPTNSEEAAKFLREVLKT
jgi:hypothetical protein